MIKKYWHDTKDVAGLAYDENCMDEYSERTESSLLCEDELLVTIDNITWIEGSISLSF